MLTRSLHNQSPSVRGLFRARRTADQMPFATTDYPTVVAVGHILFTLTSLKRTVCEPPQRDFLLC